MWVIPPEELLQVRWRRHRELVAAAEEGRTVRAARVHQRARRPTPRRWLRELVTRTSGAAVTSRATYRPVVPMPAEHAPDSTCRRARLPPPSAEDVHASPNMSPTDRRDPRFRRRTAGART